MLDRLRRRLREALDAVERRFGGGQEEAEIDRLLGRMREELIRERARLKALHEKVRDLEEKLETARRAGEAELAERVHGVLRDRRRTRAEQRETVDALTERLKEARRNRSGLAARSRRSRAAEHLRRAGRSEDRTLDRLEEEVEREVHRQEAERELREATESRDRENGASQELEEMETERRLRELRRELEGESGDSAADREDGEPKDGGGR